MDSNLEKMSGSRIKIYLSLGKDEFMPYWDKAFNKLAQSIEIKGFRPGQAPKELLAGKIPADKILSESLDSLVPDYYGKMLTENKIIPVSGPEIKVTKFVPAESLEMTMIIEVMPTITLGDWKKIKVKKEIKKVTDEDVEKEITKIKKRFCQYQDLDEPVQTGDWVELEVVRAHTLDLPDINIDRLLTKTLPAVLGAGSLIPDFEKNILGMKAGEEKDFTMKLTEEFRDKDLIGKTVRFVVKLGSAKKIIEPKLDKEFYEKLGVKDLEGLKKALHQKLVIEAERKAENELENEIIKNIVDLVVVDSIPESMVKREIDGMIANIKEDLGTQGAKYEDWLGSIKKSEAEFKKSLEPQSQESIKVGLALSEISKNENISVTDDDVKKAMERDLQMLELQVSDAKELERLKKEYQEYYSRHENIESIKNRLMGKKIMDHIKKALL